MHFINNKRLTLLSSIVLGVALSSCVGNNNLNGLSISNSVTSGSCTNMSLGQTCTVNLTYNTNNNSGLSISTTQVPNPNSSLSNFAISSCPSPAAGTSNQQCNVIITCGNGSNSCVGSGNIVFTLGNTGTTSSSSVSTSVAISATGN